MKKCVICKGDILPTVSGWKGGCNAEPVAKGRCCEQCDKEVVIPTRIQLHFSSMD